MKPKVILKPRRAQPFFGHHPWVFTGAIDRVEGEIDDGTEVELFSNTDEFIAVGLFNSQSNIRVRLYSWDREQNLDRAFFQKKIQTAILHRDDAQSARRLVFSEGDGLSGLIVDCYDRWLVVQVTALGLAQRLDWILDILEELIEPEGIFLRTARGIRELEGLELHDGLMRGSVPSQPIEIEEYGVRFLVHLQEGQKTGFYCDQRENRRWVAEQSNDCRVLDAFCYSGGFALHAARGGASSVLGIDVSESALALAKENARLNELSTVEFLQGDVFTEMETLAEAGAQFDLVILDPPKFARRRNAVKEAMRGYHRLHDLAMRLIPSGGRLLTCSCSELIDAEMLITQLSQIAIRSQREIQLLDIRGQASDHPVSLSCLESSYLTCLACRII